jgi:BA14K-like protein
MRVYSLFALALIASASVAQADSKSYCEIYAKDFASAKTSDVDQWQSMYHDSYTDCMDQYSSATTAVTTPKPVQSNPKPVVKKKVATIKVPDKTAEPAAEKSVARVAMEEGSDEWNAYCANKYVSFNKDTGTYKSHTGKERHCVVTP